VSASERARASARRGVKRARAHGGQSSIPTVEQWLDALVLERASHKDGNKRETDGRPSDGRLEDVGRHVLLGEEELGDLVVDVCQSLDQDVPRVQTL
jgi:hypothetical protein